MRQDSKMDELDGSEYCKQCGLKKVAQNGSTGALETQTTPQIMWKQEADFYAD